jgi:hypothetical protein
LVGSDRRDEGDPIAGLVTFIRWDDRDDDASLELNSMPMIRPSAS